VRGARTVICRWRRLLSGELISRGARAGAVVMPLLNGGGSQLPIERNQSQSRPPL